MSQSTTPRDRLLAVLAIAFGIEWLLLAIARNDRAAWALENALVVVAVVVLATACVDYAYQRDFAREWTESLRVKRVEPPDQALGRRAKRKTKK